MCSSPVVFRGSCALASCAQISSGTNGSSAAAPMPPNTRRRDSVSSARRACDLSSGFFISWGLRLELKGFAVDDAEHDRREAIAVAARVADDRANRRLIEMLDATPERIRQELLSEAR